MSRQDGIEFLKSIPFWDGTKTFELETPITLHHALGNPQDKVLAIHVAGTNGKGTVCAQLAAMLHASGASVGQFTSPHLTHVTERCVINGQPVSHKDFSEAINQVRAEVDRLNLNVSFFEYVASASFLVFAKQQLDWTVVEVGLGGRLDATNTITAPKATVITGIDYDHTHLLGDTLEKIAYEKAGIIKPGVPVFVGDVTPEVKKVIEEVAKSKNSPVTFVTESYDNLTSGLIGYQKDNARLSIAVAKHLGLSDEVISKGLETVCWPARLEKVRDNVLLDVSHNEAGMAALINYLEEENYSKVTFLLSFVSNKNWQEMLQQLVTFSKGRNVKFIFSTSEHHRAVNPEELQKHFGSGEVITSPEDALGEAISETTSDSLLVITGSIFFVGRLRPHLVSGLFQTIKQ